MTAKIKLDDAALLEAIQLSYSRGTFSPPHCRELGISKHSSEVLLAALKPSEKGFDSDPRQGGIITDAAKNFGI